jgi:hypothetical protein
VLRLVVEVVTVLGVLEEVVVVVVVMMMLEGGGEGCRTRHYRSIGRPTRGR